MIASGAPPRNGSTPTGRRQGCWSHRREQLYVAELTKDGRLNTHLSLIPTVGWTPLVEFRRLAMDLPSRVLVKLECEPLRKRKGYCPIRQPKGYIRDANLLKTRRNSPDRQILSW